MRPGASALATSLSIGCRIAAVDARVRILTAVFIGAWRRRKVFCRPVHIQAGKVPDAAMRVAQCVARALLVRRPSAAAGARAFAPDGSEMKRPAASDARQAVCRYVSLSTGW
jgi:hypothetical protein